MCPNRPTQMTFPSVSPIERLREPLPKSQHLRKRWLLDLPNELLLSIAEYLESESDINAFSKANRHLHELLTTYLYRRDVERGSSALLWAAHYGRETTAQKSLEAGADVQVTDCYFRTPLLLAAVGGHEMVVKL